MRLYDGTTRRNLARQVVNERGAERFLWADRRVGSAVCLGRRSTGTAWVKVSVLQDLRTPLRRRQGRAIRRFRTGPHRYAALVVAHVSLQESTAGPGDRALRSVAGELMSQDPDGLRVARVLRRTYDMLLDGQHTGRYRWDQLYKTEKTHFGTLVGGVSPAMVVGVEPGAKGQAAVGLGGVGAGVGPFVGEGAVAALDFAVGLGPAGAGSACG